MADQQVALLKPFSTARGPLPAEDIGQHAKGGFRQLGARLAGSRLVDVELVGCDLSGADLEGAAFTRVSARDARWSGVQLAWARWQDVRLVECRLDQVNLARLTAQRLWCERCTCVGADLRIAQLEGVADSERRQDVEGWIERCAELLAARLMGEPLPVETKLARAMGTERL